eukprot:6519917-Pyramimonas_sp.AAC.1
MPRTGGEDLPRKGTTSSPPRRPRPRRQSGDRPQTSTPHAPGRGGPSVGTGKDDTNTTKARRCEEQWGVSL